MREDRILTAKQIQTIALIKKAIYFVLLVGVGVGFIFVATKIYVNPNIEAYGMYFGIAIVLFTIAAILLVVESIPYFKQHHTKK